ncbi:MAG: hypothetical protein ABIZ81_12025 [Opitutaceae bacterium]
MIFFAAAATTLDKLKDIPADVWVKIGLVMLALVVVIIVLRKVAQVNKLVLIMVVLFTLSVIGFNWIYERNEPKWMTPIVEKIAPFFPAKDSYGVKQQTLPKGAR